MATRTPPSKSAAAKTRDPEGGLTAAGRAAFKARDGSRLKPGVRKPEREMSPEDMKRKGSWAVRFYGRATLPPLVDDKGRPTRFALSAHAWGEPVPATEAQARRIAEKGRKLLERYERGRVSPTGGKASAKKAPAGEGPVRRASARKATPGMVAPGKVPAKKAPAKKTASGKAPVRKAAAEKAPVRKASAPPPAAGKAAGQTGASKKAAGTKAASGKSARSR